MRPGDFLPPEAIIFRALRKQHYNPDQKAPNRTAFLRRPQEEGISVSQSLERAQNCLRGSPGVARLLTGEVTAITCGPVVIHDPVVTDDLHSEIRGLPDPYGTDAEVEAAAIAADELKRCATYIPPS